MSEVSVEGFGVVRDFLHIPGRVHVPPQSRDVLIYHVSGSRAVSRTLGSRAQDGSRPGHFAHIPAGTDPTFDVQGTCRVLHLELETGLTRRDGFFDVPIAPLRPAATLLAEWLTSRRSRTALSALAAGILHEAHALIDDTQPHRGGLKPSVARHLEAWVDAHLGAEIRESDLAAVAGLSPGHFRRAFRGSFGTSPLRYVAERRASRAQHLRAKGVASDEIIARCGLSSPRALRDLLRKQGR